MRSAIFAMWLLLHGCVGPSAPANFPVASQQSPAEAIRSGAMIVDLRVVGPPRLTVVPEAGADGASYNFFPATVSAHLTPGWRAEPGPRMVLVARYGTAQAPEVPYHPYGSFEGEVPIEDGSRYLVIFSGELRGHPEIPYPVALKRVDESGRLIDPALGFPQGTPVSTVLDPRGVPSELLRSLDAGTPTDR